MHLEVMLFLKVDMRFWSARIVAEVVNVAIK